MYTAYFTDDYYGLETIVRNNVLKGIMKHHSENMKEIHYEEGTNDKTIEYSGFSNADYYEWKDLQNPQKYNLIKDNVYLFDGYNNRIEIESTRPLIDKKRPLMYTIQNAFDGNPATAYVEDTKSNYSDYIGITIEFSEAIEIQRILIINGYSANENLYKNNNQIKTIEIGDKYSTFGKLELKNIMEPQVMDISVNENISFSIFSDELVKGRKYTDTCISELDIYNKEIGWLFGE